MIKPTNINKIYETFFKYKNILYIEKDENGNIIFPMDKSMLEFYKQILQTNIQMDNQYYHTPSKTWYQKTERAIRGEDGSFRIIEYFEDITAVKEEFYNLKVDALTNLINDRNESNKLMNDYIDYAKDTREEFSIVMADLDYFKEINDTYGHDCGDFVLKNVGNLLLNSTKQAKDKFNNKNSDIVIRFGGDEFLLLLKNISLNDTVKKVESLERKVKELNLTYVNEHIPIDMSFGYYHVDRNYPLRAMSTESLRQLISKKADAYLYQNKRAKKEEKLN